MEANVYSLTFVLKITVSHVVWVNQIKESRLREVRLNRVIPFALSMSNDISHPGRIDLL